MALPPTAKQLKLLRVLALGRGETFAVPQTRAQASREIGRFKARRRSTRIERAIERRDVSRGLAAGGDDRTGAQERDNRLWRQRDLARKGRVRCPPPRRHSPRTTGPRAARSG